MDDKKLEQAKDLQKKIEQTNRRVDSLSEKSSLEEHEVEDSTFEKIGFYNQRTNVEIGVESNSTNGYYGKISDSGKDQLKVLITVFRNSIAAVYKNELKKLEQEYEAL